MNPVCGQICCKCHLTNAIWLSVETPWAKVLPCPLKLQLIIYAIQMITPQHLLVWADVIISDNHISGQIIATSHDLTRKGSREREVLLFQISPPLVKHYNLARYFVTLYNVEFYFVSPVGGWVQNGLHSLSMTRKSGRREMGGPLPGISPSTSMWAETSVY